jgi:hypothetical protein
VYGFKAGADDLGVGDGPHDQEPTACASFCAFGQAYRGILNEERLLSLPGVYAGAVKPRPS